MKNFILKSFLIGLSSFTIFSCQQEKETSPPNFIVFIADDVSWNDFGCYGNTEVQTPNIDRIAGQGIKFSNTYLTASSCSPSRVSILSGRYPHNTGACELHTQPPVDLPGIADVLHEQGYYCGQAGKWHAGEYLKSGFDTLHTDIIMNGGEGKWLELVENRPDDQPFFFWLASLDAHRDWGENEFSGTHKASSIDPPLYMADGNETRNDLAQYYDEIKRFDHYIGRVESLLEEQEALDNTLIIIMADNGRPFPGCKTRVYDRGMKTPFIISWKNGISQKNSICESMVSVIDIAPTLADLAGSATIPETFQGKSFASLINDPSSDFRTFVFSEHNWHDYEAHERMVRTKDFLYVLNSRPRFPNQGPADVVNSPSFAELLDLKSSGQLSELQNEIFLSPRENEELFDCIEDPNQFKNIAGDPEYEQKLKELRDVLHQWMKETGDNVPENLTSDWYHRITGGKLDDNAYNQGVRGEMPGIATNGIRNNNSGPF